MPSSKPRARYEFSELRVVVVDDNADMRRLLLQILHALGFEKISLYDNGESAFEALKAVDASFVILDWHMYPIDGLTFTRMVRRAADSPNVYLPIIMLTGYTELGRVIEARDAGANEVMAKPVSPRALYSRIISLIENPRDFVRTGTFFGPDRRRKDLGPPEGTADRRSDAGDAARDDMQIVEIG